MADDFLLGLLSGALLTLMGFGLTVLWELWRHAREEGTVRKNLVAMLRLENDENLKLAHYNSERIRMNLDFIRQDKYSILPLLKFRDSAWHMVSGSSSMLKTDTNDLTTIFQLYHTIHIVNQEIESREDFRQSAIATDVFYESLSKRDVWVNQGLSDLKSRLDSAKEVLERLSK